MRDTPRPRATTGGTRPGPPQLRPGRAVAHNTGASGSGSPHRSDGCPPQTPRGARHTGPVGRSGTLPPVPGRPTTSRSRRSRVLWALVAPPALLLVLITWQVAAHGPLARADERIGGRLVRPGGVSQFLADLGGIPVAVPVLAAVLAVAALLARRAEAARWWLPSLVAALLMAAVPLLVVPLKELIDRPGPPVMAPETGFYPSGHSATAAVAYGGAVLVLWPWLRGAFARTAALLVCGALNAGTGFGLVRHGYHWPLDVLGAWCLCALPLTGLGVFLSARSPRVPTRAASSGGSRRPSPPGRPARRGRTWPCRRR
ncbi:hypothetical protein GCM10010145_46560 [Streptomyces ruber]|uniref:Phosphatidic acid phosphatase type 2/haloperoxidase domain-containing protein n=2 Tax=Streptomyces TaxID=1883 RepID=A0A918BKZ8_9ACTN|nr:phosphatase PAP2 family protein [Streptomyces ruber]GGQ71451.1 hypothetical protein GCM10010145_46560 [Streptomyces ruber]